MSIEKELVGPFRRESADSLGVDRGRGGNRFSLVLKDSSGRQISARPNPMITLRSQV